MVFLLPFFPPAPHQKGTHGVTLPSAILLHTPQKKLSNGGGEATVHRRTIILSPASCSIRSAVKLPGCETQTHTRYDRHSLGAERGNHAAAPLARLIKPAHLCLTSHLEQVAASPPEPSLFFPSRRRRRVTALLNNDDSKGALRHIINPTVLFLFNFSFFWTFISSAKVDGAFSLSITWASEGKGFSFARL